LKKVEAKFFGTRKILIPAGELESETLVATVGAGANPGSSTVPQTTPTTQTTSAEDSVAKAKFLKDWEAAKPLVAQAKAIIPDSVTGSLKAVLLQLPKTTAIMEAAASRGDWAAAADALQMIIDGATEAIAGKGKEADVRRQLELSVDDN
jgi:hypothetical protein